MISITVISKETYPIIQLTLLQYYYYYYYHYHHHHHFCVLTFNVMRLNMS